MKALKKFLVAVLVSASVLVPATAAAATKAFAPHVHVVQQRKAP